LLVFFVAAPLQGVVTCNRSRASMSNIGRYSCWSKDTTTAVPLNLSRQLLQVQVKVNHGNSYFTRHSPATIFDLSVLPEHLNQQGQKLITIIFFKGSIAKKLILP
jgi:hypothetical protein